MMGFNNYLLQNYACNNKPYCKTQSKVITQYCNLIHRHCRFSYTVNLLYRSTAERQPFFDQYITFNKKMKMQITK